MKSKRIAVRVIIALFNIGVLVLDHSAMYKNGQIEWNGKIYVPCGEQRYNEGRTLAKTTDGSWSINGEEGDSSHNFIVLRSFLDQYLFSMFQMNTKFLKVEN